MKVSREQAEKNRTRVVEVAGAQFREHGFDGIGIADLMQAAGLTHGGFYGNFASKATSSASSLRPSTASLSCAMRAAACGCVDR